MYEMILKDGTIIQIDDQRMAIFLWGFSKNWRFHKSQYNTGYAICAKGTDGVNKKIHYMHKVIAEKMGLDISGIIDHKDRNTKNNQFDNLRVATDSQSKKNRGTFKNNSSGYKNISFDKVKRKHYVYVNVNGTRKHVGYFDTIEEAVEARNKALIKYHGPFANLDD